jgi:hypothetical protein
MIDKGQLNITQFSARITAWQREVEKVDDRFLRPIYESAVHPCQKPVCWPKMCSRSGWMFEGMANKRRMWTILIGDKYGDCLGFVWTTQMSPTDIIPSRQITAVNCEQWQTSGFKGKEEREQSMRMLGYTNLSMEQVKEAGIPAPYQR